MQIAQLMERNLKTCRPTDMLDIAAELMWDHDVGALPVVDDAGMLVGIVTDRDACMAAFTQRLALHELPVSVAMTKHVVTCRGEDNAMKAADLMARHKIRRIPVVDDDDRPVGIVSLNDLALAAMRRDQMPAQQLARTLASICEHRVAVIPV